MLEKIPGRAQEGKVELAAARQIQPISADDHFGLGWMAYSIDKNNELAQQHATKAIICDPDYAYSYVLRGVLLHDQENYDWAIADYTTAIAKNPDYAVAYYNRGNAWQNKGNHDQAIADYTTAIAKDPDYADAYYNRGVVWQNKGRVIKAQQDYQTALRIEPEHSLAREDLQALEQQIAREQQARAAEQARIQEEAARAAEAANLERLNQTIFSFDSLADAIKTTTGEKRNPTFSPGKGIDNKLNTVLQDSRIPRTSITRGAIPTVMRRMSYGYATNDVINILDRQNSYSYGR